MTISFPVSFNLSDGTHVLVNRIDEETFEFHLTRLNSEKHNFYWKSNSNEIEESYETRFDHWQNESIERFRQLLN
ncbi:MAG: hypothetical protein H0U44_07860 [Flavisolibacter sp.]|jgi:hypothetical protein|nr:hypothetical protein [Flavisolibacter sp.]